MAYEKMTHDQIAAFARSIGIESRSILEDKDRPPQSAEADTGVARRSAGENGESRDTVAVTVVDPKRLQGVKKFLEELGIENGIGVALTKRQGHYGLNFDSADSLRHFASGAGIIRDFKEAAGADFPCAPYVRNQRVKWPQQAPATT